MTSALCRRGRRLGGRRSAGRRRAGHGGVQHDGGPDDDDVSKVRARHVCGSAAPRPAGGHIAGGPPATGEHPVHSLRYTHMYMTVLYYIDSRVLVTIVRAKVMEVGRILSEQVFLAM